MQVMDYDCKLEKLCETYFIQHCLASFPYHMYEFKMADVEVDSIVPLCRYVFNERLTFARQLVELYETSSIALFEPCIRYDSFGRKSIIAPPVIEQRDGVNILCDGMHRVYSVIRDDLKNIKVLLVKNHTLPLPGELNSWENVCLMPEQLPVETNFINFKREGLTGYSKFFNDECFLNL